MGESRLRRQRSESCARVPEHLRLRGGGILDVAAEDAVLSVGSGGIVFKDEARRILAALEERYASTRGGAREIAQVSIGLGEFARAFEWLSRAVDDGGVRTLKVAAVWDPIRSDRRFGELLRKSGLGG